MLAYAGQGLSGKENSQSSSQVRDYLKRAVDALSGLAESYAEAVRQENFQPAERYLAFLAVLERDAQDSLAVDSSGSRASQPSARSSSIT